LLFGVVFILWTLLIPRTYSGLDGVSVQQFSAAVITVYWLRRVWDHG